MLDDEYVAIRKRKGRPAKDPVERLRVTIWYLAVKARKGWSDYRLDQEFAWEEGKTKRSGADRLRIFEGIRYRSTVPSSGNHYRRQFDLILRVDAHPDFSGTAAIFHSPFWTLLKAQYMGLTDACDFVKQQMRKCGVHRPSEALDHILSAYMHQAARERQISPPSYKDLYATFLDGAIKDLPFDLDLLALIGGMFREAYLVCSLETAAILKKKFLELIEAYAVQPWLSPSAGHDFVDIAERRVLHWQMAENFWGEGLYDDWPTSVVDRWLVKLDSEMLDLISKEDELYEKIRMSYRPPSPNSE